MRFKSLVIIILSILVFSSISYAEKKKVLVLHSYHQGLNWTDNITRGLLSVFKQYDNLEIQFEYMDTKRNSSPGYIEEFSKFYSIKHHNIPFEVVIASDRKAFDFVRKYRNTIFKDIPIVFVAVTYEENMTDGFKDVTGVAKQVEFKTTTELALRFHPDIKNLVVINDNRTPAAIDNRNIFVKFWPELNTDVNLVFLENLTINELIAKVKALDESNIIFLLNYSQDEDGNYFSYQENIEIIREATNLPIYSSWEFYLNEGTVGGMLTSGYTLGKLAAGTVLRVLNGEDVNSIPIINTGSNRYKFDHKILTRYGILPGQLPDNSIVVNRPPSFYEKHKVSVYIFLSFVLVMFLTIIVARVKRIHNERKLLRENKKLEEAKLRFISMLDASSDGVWEHDMTTGKVEISEQIWTKLGYSYGEIRNTNDFFEMHMHPDDRERIRNLRDRYINGEFLVYDVEFRLRSKENVWHWYRAKGKFFDRTSSTTPSLLVGTLTDITLAKKAEMELKETEGKILNAIIDTEEKERKRFSKDLHDTIGPLISSINLYLSALEGDVKEERKNEILKVSHDVVNEVIVNLKEISNNLSPHILSDFGLKNALESFVENIKLSQSINIKLDMQNLDERLDENVEVVVYRVIIELINNTIKHAKAENIEINIFRVDDVLKFIYIDDGIGFNTCSMDSGNSQGMGMYNIHSRIKSLNGTCIFKSNKNIGGMMAVVEINLRNKQ